MEIKIIKLNLLFAFFSLKMKKIHKKFIELYKIHNESCRACFDLKDFYIHPKNPWGKGEKFRNQNQK